MNTDHVIVICSIALNLTLKDKEMLISQVKRKKISYKTSIYFIKLILLLSTTKLFSFQITGEGHYGLRPGFEQARAGDKSKGRYQASEQSFRLMTEFRSNDRASFFAELSLFPTMKSLPWRHSSTKVPKSDSTTSCYQSVRDPGYQPSSQTLIKLTCSLL